MHLNQTEIEGFLALTLCLIGVLATVIRSLQRRVKRLEDIDNRVWMQDVVDRAYGKKGEGR